MPLTDEEKMAYDLLLSLTPEDLTKPLEGLTKVLPIFEAVKAPIVRQVTALNEKREAEQRAVLIAQLCRTERISHEDAVRVVDALKEHPLEHEIGPCRACDGTGSQFHPGCIGGSYKKCPKCHDRNSRRQLRIRLFWDPNGDPVSVEQYFQTIHSSSGDVSSPSTSEVE